MSMKFTPRFALVATLATVSASSFGQAIPGADHVHLTCNLGSFRIQGTDKLPAQGHLDFSFKGTFLVVGLEGKIQVTGNVKKEFESSQSKRQVYFGKGRVVIDGVFKTAEWFGQDMTGDM